MEIKGSKTLRGQRRYAFTDSLGQACDITEVPDVGKPPAIWFGRDIVGKRMCLTQDQVAALMPYLVYFIEQGELPMVLPTPPVECV